MRLPFTRGLSFRLAAYVLSATAVVFVLITATTYYMTRKALLADAEQSAWNLLRSTVYRIEAVLAPISRVPQGVAYDLEDSKLSEADMWRRERRVLDDNPEIFGMAIAFEPNGYDARKRHFAPYTYRTPLGPAKTWLGGAAYRYENMDWYQIPRELRHTIWTEPYFDQGGGNALMATCSVPFFHMDNGRTSVAGVVTADVSLEWLKRLVASVSVLDSGYAYLLTRTGTYVTHPAQGVPFNESIFTRAEEHGDQDLRKIGQDMVRGGSRLVLTKSLHTGKEGYLCYAPLPSTGWSLGIFAPHDELFANVNQLSLVTGALSAGGFLLLAILIASISRTITGPIRRLAGAARAVAEGDLSAPLPEVRSRDEVRELTESFRHMQGALADYIRDLTVATASRERMESELRIAHDIQMGILPKLFPPFPDCGEFDLHATLTPAREVGGDFYDFFRAGPDWFCFLVGDVSGKGVPAAFYMAVAKTLIKAVAGESAEADPGAILSRASDDLAQDNESCMFVTIFCGMLNMKTGEVRYACAGHNPPLLLSARSKPADGKGDGNGNGNGGGNRWLPVRREPVAGALPGVAYTTDSLWLTPGDTLVLFTDGVTEAMNPAQELYGEDRLLACAQAAKSAGDQTGQGLGSTRALTEAIGADVVAFAAGAEQSDDITMLVLTYLGTGESAG